MDSCATDVHSQKQREDAPAWHPNVVGQAAARSDAIHPGSILRAAVQRPFTRLPTSTWVPHRPIRDLLTWKGTEWFIEGDIKGCFDNIDHKTLMSIIREKIHDGRFMNLIEKLLEAGYLQEWDYRPTLSGTPQGGMVSPLLANIYLDRLDKFVEQATSSPSSRKGARDVDLTRNTSG